jgi:predicted Fe-S protein YdhL (DUF1289 family)
MNGPEQNSLIIDSPCTRTCCLDLNDVCVGCFRTLDEILAWSSLDNAQKKTVLSQCEQRKKSRKNEAGRNPS